MRLPVRFHSHLRHPRLSHTCAREQRLECAGLVQGHNAALATVVAAAQELAANKERRDGCPTGHLRQFSA